MATAPASGWGKIADDGRRAPGGVDGLDDVHRCASMGTSDGLAAEDEDLPPQRGDSRVTHRYRQRGDRRERPAVGGGQHRGVGPVSVVAAHDICGAADGDRRGIGAWRGQ